MLRNKKGFTLIELLLVSGLILVIGVCIVSSLRSGIGFYQRLNGLQQESRAAIFFEQMTRDVSNFMEYSLVPFEGKDTEITFASLYNAASKEGDFDMRVAKIHYVFDAENHRVIRQEERSADAQQPDRHKEEVMLENIKTLTFEYSRLAEGTLPLKIHVTLYDDRFGGSDKLTKDIQVPVTTYVIQTT